MSSCLQVYVELHKESSDQSLGFSIAGGKGASTNLQEGDTVSAVLVVGQASFPG